MDDISKLRLVGIIENHFHSVCLEQLKEFFHSLQQIACQNICAMCLLKAAQQRTTIVNIDATHFASTSGKLVLVLFNIDNAQFVLEDDVLWNLNAQPQHIELDMLILLYLFSVLCSNVLLRFSFLRFLFIVKTETELLPLYQPVTTEAVYQFFLEVWPQTITV